MGMRLHAAKTYKVEWGDSRGFNYQTAEFHNLLYALDVDYSGETYDDDFEVDVDEWKKGINELKNYKMGDDENIDAAIKKLNCSIDDIVERMEWLYEDADKDDGYMHLAFY